MLCSTWPRAVWQHNRACHYPTAACFPCSRVSLLQLQPFRCPSLHQRLGQTVSRQSSAARTGSIAEVERLRAEIKSLQAEKEDLLQLQKALITQLSSCQSISAQQVYADALAEIQVASKPQPGKSTEKKDKHASSRSSQRHDGRSVKDQAEEIIWPKSGEREAWNRETSTRPHPAKRKSSAVEATETPLHIVHISAEFAPAAKVGGLADVITGLARSFVERGHKAETILPYYQCLGDGNVQDLQHITDFGVPKGSFFDGCMHQGSLKTSAFSGKIDGLPVILLRPDWSSTNLFQGSGIYAGSYNETEAYLYFCRASLEFLRVTDSQPHILHVHDWQTAAVPMLFWEHYHATCLGKSRLVFTIHNLHSQGECRQEEFAATGMSGESFADVHKALDERTIGHNPERLCLMKGGIVYSNLVTTVSPTYAKEATEGGAAGWLKSTLLRPDITKKFEGILNGIDTGLWDPQTDPVLPAPFDFDRLQGKQMCKRFLQKALQLEEAADKPLVIAITRLVPQKGIHLLRQAVYRTAEQGGQFVLLGTGYDSGIFEQMAETEYRDSSAVKLMIMYSDRLAHLLYAAADIVLVPSLFEPCGLTQLVGMRYGAVPLVRCTGGLADTVQDMQGENGNGYVFEGTDEASLCSALDKAFADYKDQDKWLSLVRRNMSADYSWHSSASKYLELYSKILQQ